jgi:hypothetical protein
VNFYGFFEERQMNPGCRQAQDDLADFYNRKRPLEECGDEPELE